MATVISGRVLGKVSYGELGIILSTVGLMSTFAALGLGLTGTKYVAEYWRKDSERTGRIIGLSIWISILSGGLISTVLFLISPWLAERMLNAPHLGRQIQISSGFLFFETLNGVLIGIMAGFEAFKTIAQVRLWRGIINLPIVAVCVWLFGLTGAVSAMVAVAALAWVINWQALMSLTRDIGIPVSYRGSTEEKQILWRFSIPALLAGIMVGPISWRTNTFLTNQPGGYAEMGVYTAASQWGMSVLFLPNVLSQAVMPMLSSFYGDNDKKSTKKLLWISVLISALTSFPILLLLILFRKSIMGLFGTEFVASANVLIIVSLTVGFLAIETPIGKIIAASGKMWMGVIMNFGWAVVLFLSGWYLVRQGYGAYGLAIAYLLAYIVHGFWTYAFALHLLKD